MRIQTYKLYIVLVGVMFGFVFSGHAQDTAKPKPANPVLAQNTFTADMISLYPNPTNEGIFRVEAKGMNQIEIIDIFGRIILKKGQCDEAERLDVSNLREGLYFIRVTTSDKGVAVARFIKK